MIKEMSYQEKIECVRPWLFQVIKRVKKDLQQEHLVKDMDFCCKYFLGRGLNTVTLQQMVDAYACDIAAGNVGLGEFIANRWLIKNKDVYDFFEKKLQQVNPDFDQLEQLEEVFSWSVMESAVKEFGPVRTYLFVIFNSVVFPSPVIAELKNRAEHAPTR